MILLNPGPVTLSARVREAMLGDDLCHREVEFADLQGAIREKLLRIYALDGEQWAAVLLTGSGTAAVEAMITSTMPHTGKLLVIENGVYGERMHQIAKCANIDVLACGHAWGDELDIEAIEKTLSSNPTISHVAVVHHETTTGRLNDLDPLANACREYKVKLLLDAVSSFGAEAIDFSWPIDACAATANKCLHGVPGTAFAICRRSALSAAKGSARNVYLDLNRYLTSQDANGTPFTQSIQTFYALNEALDEFFEQGGWEQRRATYRSRLHNVRGHLVSLGVKPILDENDTSCVLHSYALPDGLSYATLHDALKTHGFIIYAGQGELAKRVFRISMMGEISAADIERLKQALSGIIQSPVTS